MYEPEDRLVLLPIDGAKLSGDDEPEGDGSEAEDRRARCEQRPAAMAHADGHIAPRFQVRAALGASAGEIASGEIESAESAEEMIAHLSSAPSPPRDTDSQENHHQRDCRYDRRRTHDAFPLKSHPRL